MLSMNELMKDRTYARFIDRAPDESGHAYDRGKQVSPPWVVYVQRRRGGTWAKREFWRYKKALKFFHKALRVGVHDVTINNKRVETLPPEKRVRVRGKYVTGSDGVKRQATKAIPWHAPIDEGGGDMLEWCVFCRRPTEFRYYSKHKRLAMIDISVRRCCICGASTRIALVPSKRRRA